MNNDATYDYEYYEGFYLLRNEKREVFMDEATFDTYRHAYLVSHGMETRTQEELEQYATSVGQQQCEVEKLLYNPEYWIGIDDPNIRIIPLRSTCQPMPTDKTEATSIE
jgi:hypothetical protein